MLKIKTGNFLFLFIYIIFFALGIMEKYDVITFGLYNNIFVYSCFIIVGILLSFKSAGSGKSFINIRSITKGKIFKNFVLGILLGLFMLLVTIKYNMNIKVFFLDSESTTMISIYILLFIFGGELFFRGFLLNLYKSKDRLLGVALSAFLYGIMFSEVKISLLFFVIAILLSGVVIASKSIVNSIIIMFTSMVFCAVNLIYLQGSLLHNYIEGLVAGNYYFYLYCLVLAIIVIIFVLSYREKVNDYTRITGDEGFLGRQKESMLTWHIIIVCILFIVNKVDIFIN